MKHFPGSTRLGAFVLMLAMPALITSGVGAQQNPSVETNLRKGAKLLALDAELREAFATRPFALKLPEASRKKLPDASVAKFDWVTMVGLTPIKDQGGASNCVAQAHVAAFEWNWQIRNGTKTKPFLSPQPVIDRLQLHGPLPHEGVLDQLLLHGTANLSEYPYTGVPGELRSKVRTPYRIAGWGSLGPRGKISVNRIKQALLDYGPVVTGVYVTPAFKNYKGGVFAEHYRAGPQASPTTHAVVIVGWDDQRGKGCWHIQNSWGLKWGEDGGGMWIEYGSNNIGYHIRWMRAQSIHYHLPPDAHKLLGDKADPFLRWPSAITVALPKKE